MNLSCYFCKMIQWLTNLFSTTKTEKSNITDMNKFLIVGLGNIGAEYVNTRHNIGFKIVDFLAKEVAVDFQTVKLGAIAEYKIKGKTMLLLKPNTYMNLSGKAVQYWMEKEKIKIENVLIVTDDLNLSFGTIRIKPKGTDGGHNGLKSIQQILNSSEYPRFRFGISDEFKKGRQIDYVLGAWNEIETEKLPERLKMTAEVLKCFALSGLENTMTTYNGK